jgi:hypothetical protein
LHEAGFVRIAQAEGRRYLCLVNPLSVLAELARAGRFNPERLQALNDDLEVMDLEPVAPPLPPNVLPMTQAPRMPRRA